jgi:Caspase domain
LLDLLQTVNMARRAALFGCNYAGTNNALHGCINDVRAVHEMLVYAYQFDPQVGGTYNQACIGHRRIPTALVGTLCNVARSTPSTHLAHCVTQNITVMTDDREPLPTGANMKVCCTAELVQITAAAHATVTHRMAAGHRYNG